MSVDSEAGNAEWRDMDVDKENELRSFNKNIFLLSFHLLAKFNYVRFKRLRFTPLLNSH